jgi:hypothetical protein
MRFMVLRKADASTEAGVTPGPELIDAMGRYNQELVKAGVMRAGDGLKPSAAGTRVRYQNKKFTVIDGPFSETKELIAGFSIIEAKSKQEAIELLKRWPAVDGGGAVELELRQIYELSDFPVDASEKPDGWRENEQRWREQEQKQEPADRPARKPGTTRFLVMIRADARSESGQLPGQEVLSAMGALMDDMLKAEAVLGGEGLKPSKLGARISFRGGKASIVDGPFAETKELIAGYTLVQLASRAEAIAFAKRWLEVHALLDDGQGHGGEIEIRPLFELEDFPLTTEQRAVFDGLAADLGRAKEA